MTINDKDYIVGYKRPPLSTRWQKGKSGNPRNKRCAPPRLSDLVEKEFERTLSVNDGGASRVCTILEAILMQLWLNVAAGKKRALRVLRKYEAFCKARPEYIVWTDADLKAAADSYERSLNTREGSLAEQRAEDKIWRNLTLKQAAERYEEILKSDRGDR